MFDFFELIYIQIYRYRYRYRHRESYKTETVLLCIFMLHTYLTFSFILIISCYTARDLTHSFAYYYYNPQSWWWCQGFNPQLCFSGKNTIRSGISSFNQHVSLRQCLQLSAHNSSIKSQQWLRITNEKSKPGVEWCGVKTMVSHSDRFIRNIPSALLRSI